MATPKDFEDRTHILQAPRGKEDTVLPLPTHINDKSGIYISCWKLSPEEIERIKTDGCVWLGVYSTVHPPVFVSGMKEMLPFKEETSQ